MPITSLSVAMEKMRWGKTDRSSVVIIVKTIIMNGDVKGAGKYNLFHVSFRLLVPF